MNQCDLHNRMVVEIIKLIVEPTIKSGGRAADVLVLLESVITGVIFYLVKIGGDEIVVDRLMAGVKQRLAEKRASKERLAVCDTVGEA